MKIENLIIEKVRYNLRFIDNTVIDNTGNDNIVIDQIFKQLSIKHNDRNRYR